MKQEVDTFLKLPHFLHDPIINGNLISGSSASSKPSLHIWKFLIHVLLKPSLKDFVDDLDSLLNECDCAVVWTFFAFALIWY